MRIVTTKEKERRKLEAMKAEIQQQYKRAIVMSWLITVIAISLLSVLVYSSNILG